MYPSIKFMRCLQFAANKHCSQRRKNANKTPYINHPINVATILTEANINEEVVLMAALLHDTVEDTDTTFDEIEMHFGTEVCNIVREVTDDKSLPKEMRKQLQIENAAACSREAKLVKLADKLDNLLDLQSSLPEGWTEERRQQYFIWAKKIVEQISSTNTYMEQKLNEIFKQQKNYFL